MDDDKVEVRRVDFNALMSVPAAVEVFGLRRALSYKILGCCSHPEAILRSNQTSFLFLQP